MRLFGFFYLVEYWNTAIYMMTYQKNCQETVNQYDDGDITKKLFALVQQICNSIHTTRFFQCNNRMMLMFFHFSITFLSKNTLISRCQWYDSNSSIFFSKLSLEVKVKYIIPDLTCLYDIPTFDFCTNSNLLRISNRYISSIQEWLHPWPRWEIYKYQ